MKSLSRTRWNYKYHIVFKPKYRRQIIYGNLKVELGKILRQLCEWKEVKIIEATLCKDPCAYACGNSTKNSCFKLRRVSERQEQFNAT